MMTTTMYFPSLLLMCNSEMLTVCSGIAEKDVHRTDRNIALFAGEDTPHPNPDSPFSEVGTNVHLEQLKDMLLTYNEYNRDLGYVQGMSDLLAPIYAVLQDDALAFWGFVGFMERMVSLPTRPWDSKIFSIGLTWHALITHEGIVF
jgi:hypothetical protein